jgi:hypothetical protein
MEPVIPDFAGKTVLIARIDYGFYLWTADNWEIRLAGPVLVSAAGAQPAEIEVDVPDSPLPPELDGVVGATITQLLVAEDGHLGVQLGDRLLSARVADDYEAWQVAGQDGERLICMPGGELAYFPPVRRDRAPSSTPATPVDVPPP